MDITEMIYRANHPEEFESISKPKGVVGMRLFPDGAWVKLTLKDYPFSIGYVDGYSYLTGNYFVKLTIIKGMPVSQKLIYNNMTFPSNCLSLVDELETVGFDTSFLIDLALATKDQEWFDQLIKGGNE